MPGEYTFTTIRRSDGVDDANSREENRCLGGKLWQTKLATQGKSQSPDITFRLEGARGRRALACRLSVAVHFTCHQPNNLAQS